MTFEKLRVLLMVVCSCNVISDRDIKTAVQTLSERCPDAKLSAANILGEMGCIHDCCGCVPHLKQIVRDSLAQ